jgi:hypothetical membrane protein
MASGDRRAAAVAGIAGPTAFVAAWAVGGARTPGYSPVEQAISRIAEIGAPQRPVMTAGFVAFGVAVPAFALVARRRLGWRTAASLVVAGVATLGVAATPLEDGRDDTAHAVLAGVGYGAMALAPLVVRHRRAGDAAVGLVAAAALLGTAVGPASGLLQRLGLGVVDAWIVHRASRLLDG